MPSCAACGAPLPGGARFCPACAAPVEAVPAAEERKLATVLFADLVGSTALASEQDPERTRALLDRFYDAMAGEIAGAGGTVEKFVGDAVVAAFGAPTAQEDHAERALHTALSMQLRLRELFGERLQLRIGVNTGEVVVGRPREGSSFVSGDPVNVAARLEQAAAPGEILAGERTVAAVRGAFEFAEPATVEAKGKPDGVACRRLVRALTLMRPRGISGLQPAFVGREAELELLQATYRRVVAQGEPHLVTIMGDAGVGKTRLLRELWRWLAGESPQPVQRTGRCLPYGQITYWALGEVLKEHFWILESDPPETALARLAPRDILGLTLGLDVAADVHPVTARDRLHGAWVDFLQELVAERPAVVLVEDLYWAEEPLLDLLERLVRDVRGPLLLVGTARPELLDRRPAWGAGRRNSSVVWLEPLSAQESELMLEELLASELPAQLREVIVEQAEGNPFFVEELVGSLIDQGFLWRRNGRWTVQELPAGFSVPDSVQAILAARIDLLGQNEKAALQAASVIGRIFWQGPARELLGGTEPDWALLEDRDFVRRRHGSSIAGENEYAFKHALTREVAYATLPKARRAHLHAAFADWLERLGEGRDEHAPLLAHHYAEAVRPDDADLAWAGEEAEVARLREKAVSWLRRAAELAVGRYEIDEGLSLLHQALGLESTRRGEAELWHVIGCANALKFAGEEFSAAMEKAIELTDDRGEIADLYADLAHETAGRWGMWRQAPDRELVEEWIGRALELAEPESRTCAKALVARAWLRDDAAVAAEASALAERLGDTELRSGAWQARSVVAMESGDFQQALTWAQRPFDLVGDLADPDLVADVYAHAIGPSLVLGRIREARRLAGQFEEVNASLTPHHRVHGVAMLLELAELLGSWDEIRALEPRTHEAVEGNVETPCVRNARSLLVCAIADVYVGELAASERREERAEELAHEGYGAVLDGPRIRLAVARRDLERLERLLAQPPAMGRRRAWFHISPVTARLEGLTLLGDRRRLEEEAAAVLKPGTYFEPFALRALGIVRGDGTLIEQALARFEALRLDWHAEQTRLVLAGVEPL